MTRIEEIKASRKKGLCWGSDVDWLLERNAELLEALRTAQNHLHMYVGNAYETTEQGLRCKECFELSPLREGCVNLFAVTHDADCWTYAAIKADLQAQTAIAAMENE